MKINDLLLELKTPKPKFDIEHYGNYIVTMSTTPVVVPSITGDTPQFVTKVQHKTQKDKVALAAGKTQGESRDNAFVKIHATDRPEDPDAFKQFTIDLNAPFFREYSDSRSGNYYKISKVGNTPVLVMASRQYFAAFGKDMESLGFKKVSIRSKSTAGPDAAEMYSFQISKNQIKSLGLIPNMRYSLEEIEQDSDGNRMFKMIPDTRTTGPKDRYRMPGPGLTLAATMKESLDESIVTRRGNKLHVGTLELQLYHDHIFYVIDGGKVADLSIYKDDAFKPSRSNEIYLKDAKSHRVPQPFIDLFADFFRTQDIDAVVNGLEALATKKKDIDEALLSPRVHEIFLKGLIGAILAGGLNYGINYAKEKTAEYDRQGLQSIYKSIDPREYPQLTKKLTPKDKKGLDAIVNNLKEHAMRMEDITEEENESMSREGKGVMKYGKKGMKVLAKAGRDGASEKELDNLRDKYNKYDEALEEKWSQKYKDSINCSNPKGFSQKAHCAGKKKNEGTEPDHEASMAKGELYNAIKNAMELFKMIENGENLEGWVASKITKAADYLNSVHDYMAYEKKSMNEEKKRLDPKCWKGYRKAGTKMKGGVRVNKCVKVKK